MEFEGDLFSGLEEPEATQQEARPYDQIIESRKNTTFAAEQIESQDEVQVVHHAYPIEEVKAAAKEYFHGDALAGDVWANKYALKDSDGNIYELTPDDMHHRIAREIARIERRYPNPMKEEEIYEVLKDFRYIVPQGSPMTGIGLRRAHEGPHRDSRPRKHQAFGHPERHREPRPARRRPRLHGQAP